MDNTHRIRRLDKHNIIIQRRVNTRSGNEKWLTVSYCGNSPFSLASELLRLAMAQHTPKDENLSNQVKTLQLELVLSRDKLESMITDMLNKQGD